MIDIFEESAKEYHGWFDQNEPVYQSELLAITAFLLPAGRGLEIGVGAGRFAAPLASGISICGGSQASKCEVSITLKCDVPCVWPCFIF